MLKFEASIDGMVAPNCYLRKRVEWVLSEVHGNGTVSNGGLTMKGGEGYCWRVGACCFESGIHTWKVSISKSHSFGSNCEVGVFDYEEINADAPKSKNKWVLSCKVLHGGSISLTVDMDKKTLKIIINSDRYDPCDKDYQFVARRVSPFFACQSPALSINLKE